MILKIVSLEIRRLIDDDDEWNFLKHYKKFFFLMRVFSQAVMIF